ncbi:MAG: prepilin-type N-terminal cleavage/methylation domain-containing protein [Fibrobacter sp.]|nr:prepilin-type N-terminal cleavage/methylation domain-containing protein [Fibrobacter sp.]
MSLNKGFSLVEILTVIVIMAVASGFAVNSFSKMVANNRLQKAAFELQQELSTIRPMALKNDCKVMVRFSEAACSVYVDKNGDGKIQIDEFRESWEAPEGIVFKLPSDNPPTSAPSGAVLPSGGKYAAGQWSDYLQFANDALGRVNTGSVYLSSKKLKKTTYCITSVNSQTLKIYSWDGSKWNAL